MREVTIFRFRCPCRNDSCSSSRAGWRVPQPGNDCQREGSIHKLIRKLGPPEQLRTCCEAGPTGFVLYWQLGQLASAFEEAVLPRPVTRT